MTIGTQMTVGTRMTVGTVGTQCRDPMMGHNVKR